MSSVVLAVVVVIVIVIVVVAVVVDVPGRPCIAHHHVSFVLSSSVVVCLCRRLSLSLSLFRLSRCCSPCRGGCRSCCRCRCRCRRRHDTVIVMFGGWLAFARRFVGLDVLVIGWQLVVGWW